MSKKNNLPYIPYTYLIGWSKLDTWYYGSEFAQKSKIANPQNLWTIYFTSSKHVKEFREKHGEPDVIQIRRIFKSRDECVEWEHKVLRRMKVIYSDRWLNKTDNKVISTLGKPCSTKTKKKISNALIGRSKSKEHCLSISVAARNRPPKTKNDKDKISKFFSQTSWWNNGQIQKRSKDCPGEEWIRGRLNMSNKNDNLINIKAAQSNIGSMWWTNGIEEIKSKNSPGIEWKRGRLFKKRKRKTKEI